MQWNKATMTMAIPTKNLDDFGEPCSLSIIYSNRKTPIIQTTLPEISWLLTQYSFDYSNSYLTTCKDTSNELNAEDLVVAFGEVVPPLFKRLFANRKENQHGALKNMAPIIYQSENEVVFEMTNSSLDYKISLALSKPRRGGVQKNIILSTTVSFKNPLGRLYFMLLRPVYERLLLTTLKQMVETMAP